MHKGINPLVAGIAVAMTAGAVTYVATGKRHRSVKKLKRSASKAMRVMEDLAGNMSYMMK